MTQTMITWVLVDVPTYAVERAIEMVEARLGSEGEISWISPMVDPIQD